MFTTDERTENFLRFNGIKYEYSDCSPFSCLHDNWRVANLGRKNAIDEDAVLDYSCRMEAGSAAPAPIVMQQTDGYCVLDGVQRLCASLELGNNHFCAYVVSKRTSISKQHIVRICANGSINGQHTPDKGFLLQAAVEILYFGDNCSVEEIARAIGRTPDQVKAEVRYQKTVAFMEEVGYTGKLTNRKTSKWLGSMIGRYADQDDWRIAPGPLKELLVTIDKCGFKNGTIEEHVEDFFDVKRTARKDRHAQFEAKLRDFKKSPEVQQKLKSERRTCNLDNVLPALRRLNTTLEKAIAANELVHDGDFALKLAECLRLVYVNTKNLVPRDLQYINGRRSSIFDKG